MSPERTRYADAGTLFLLQEARATYAARYGAEDRQREAEQADLAREIAAALLAGIAVVAQDVPARRDARGQPWRPRGNRVRVG